MQVAFGRSAVLAGGKYHQEITRQKLPAGQAPLAGLTAVVGERPAGHLDGLGAKVANLDPVSAVTVLVAQPALVGGEQLVDHQLANRGIRVNNIAPTLSGEVIWRHEEVADPVVAGPAYCHLAFRWLLETEDVGPRFRTVHGVGGAVVDEKVCGINAADGLAEGHLDTLQVPHPCIEPGKESGDARGGRVNSYRVDEGEIELGVARGEGRVEELHGDGVGARNNELRGGGQVENFVRSRFVTANGALIKGRVCRRVFRRHLDPVDPENKPVVKINDRLEGDNQGRVRDIQGVPQVDGGVVAPHGRVGLRKIGAEGRVPVAEGGRAQEPS